MTTTARAPHLADWALAHGRSAMTTSDIANLLRIPVDQVSERLAEPGRRGEWATPARGLWLPVPPELRTWGAPPGLEMIVLIAGHIGVDYYVGWLSAAHLYGAAHQSPQGFQVAVSRQLRDRTVGRTRFAFRRRAGIADLPARDCETRSGRARVASPELVALDIARDVSFAGGLDNAATVIADLHEVADLDSAALTSLATHFPASAVRRLGWLLEETAGADGLDQLRDVANRGPTTPARIDPTGDLIGPLDRRWNVRLNRRPEPDR